MNWFLLILKKISTQIPIISWENRYLTPREGARIQCLENIELPETNVASFSVLGNAVNFKLVRLIAENLIKECNTP
ncbi:MAG: DNA cytosine methyltransferase [Tenacibaculum sp.]